MILFWKEWRNTYQIVLSMLSIFYLHISTAAPVTSKLAKARGNITFQPQDMS